MSRSTILLSLLALAFFVAAFFVRWSSRIPGATVMIKGDIIVHADIADTEAKRAQGLGGRPSLPDGEGMLFLFSEKKQHTFWMKDMQFPIDIIWIVDGKVADVTFDVPVSKTGELPLYAPWVPVDRVLEVPAGFIGRYGISVGDAVEITY